MNERQPLGCERSGFRARLLQFDFKQGRSIEEWIKYDTTEIIDVSRSCLRALWDVGEEDMITFKMGFFGSFSIEEPKPMFNARLASRKLSIQLVLIYAPFQGCLVHDEVTFPSCGGSLKPVVVQIFERYSRLMSFRKHVRPGIQHPPTSQPNFSHHNPETRVLRISVSQIAKP